MALAFADDPVRAAQVALGIIHGGKEARLRAKEERARRAMRARLRKRVRERLAKWQELSGEDLEYEIVKPANGYNVTRASQLRRMLRGRRVLPKIQAIFRGQRVRTALVRLHYNAVVIQCAFRAWIARWTRYCMS